MVLGGKSWSDGVKHIRIEEFCMVTQVDQLQEEEEVKNDIISAMTNNVHEKTSAEFENIVQEAQKKDE